ncbi:MAG TPA: endo-1,4-beta-xylanase [Anaerolineales bacterium]|nr:endo-1,4-beta-xylanase [Anaerolineales bacterium]
MKLNKSKLSRREFLKLTGTISTGLALSACGVKATEVPTATATRIVPTQTSTPTPIPTSTPIPSPTPIPSTLRGYADALGIRIGAVAEGVVIDDQTRLKLLAEQFNQIAITTLAWEVIGQRQNSYTFRIPDAHRGFASAHDLTVMGMHLVYGVDLPEWLQNGNFSREELIDLLKNHIRKVMSHYRGKIRAYTVVNEATEPSIFWNRRVGSEYVEIAFQTARETDPDAILIYNDYAHETASLYKAEQVFKVVESLKAKDLVDAVGMQMHILGGFDLDPRTPPTKEQLLEQMHRYGSLGLKVFVTELDVGIAKLPGSVEEKLAKQAEIYSTVVEACLESDGICTDINIWGVNDVDTWTDEAALLFSDNQPKPAYFAVLDVLKKFYEARK